MDIKQLLGIRPKAQGAAAIRVAMENATRAKDEATRVAARLEAGRSALLLDGTPADVQKGEAALLTARADAERAGAMLDGLRERLVAAEAQEAMASARALAEAADAAAVTAVEFNLREYPALARQMATGLQLNIAADDARIRAHEFFEQLPVPTQEVLIAEGYRIPRTIGERMHNTFQLGSFAWEVRLPDPASLGAPLLWPPGQVPGDR